MAQTPPTAVPTAIPVAISPVTPPPNPSPSTIQIPAATNPALNNLPLPQNLTPNPSLAPATSGPKSATESKYSEYQSYCRSNIYDVENEYSQFLKSDVTLSSIKDLIDKRQFFEAEKLVRSSR